MDGRSPTSAVDKLQQIESRFATHRRAERARRSGRRPPIASVVIPTYNEAFNIATVLDRIAACLDGFSYEVIVVDDDSPDRTWEVAGRRARSDTRVSVIRRRAMRGLSSAVLAGLRVAEGDVLVVMDADLQHDEKIIPLMVESVLTGDVDVCVGSREASGGSYGTFGRRRRAMSWFGASLAQAVLRVPVQDPMSGFFAISRERFDHLVDDVNPRGFKILLEFLARGPRPTVAEIGYTFGERINGETKLSGSVMTDYGMALAALRFARFRATLRRLRPMATIRR